MDAPTTQIEAEALIHQVLDLQAEQARIKAQAKADEADLDEQIDALCERLAVWAKKQKDLLDGNKSFVIAGARIGWKQQDPKLEYLHGGDNKTALNKAQELIRKGHEHASVIATVISTTLHLKNLRSLDAKVAKLLGVKMTTQPDKFFVKPENPKA
jgi:hypothetical protein